MFLLVFPQTFDHTPSMLVLSNQIVIMAAIRDAAYGGIAVDSIVLSPECRVSSGETFDSRQVKR